MSLLLLTLTFLHLVSHKEMVDGLPRLFFFYVLVLFPDLPVLPILVTCLCHSCSFLFLFFTFFLSLKGKLMGFSGPAVFSPNLTCHSHLYVSLHTFSCHFHSFLFLLYLVVFKHTVDFSLSEVDCYCSLT